jgi:HEAT repeat protein
MLPLMPVVLGCAASTEAVGKFVSRPFRKTVEQTYGIKTPADRVKELRKLAKGATRQPAAEQEANVARLADDFQRESDPWVRRETLRALAHFPQPSAGAVLVAALGDNDVETRRTACQALGVRGDDIAVRELARVVSSETNQDVRIAAVKALGASGNKQSLVPLSEVMLDADPALQAQAQESLVAVSGRDYGSDVEAWRQFAQSGKTDAPEISFAEKLRRAFY